MAVGIRRADHATLSAKVGISFADKRLSVGIVRSRTQATEFSFRGLYLTCPFSGALLVDGPVPTVRPLRLLV
jgi:hypothetical protein